jgi:cell division protein FtsB
MEDRDQQQLIAHEFRARRMRGLARRLASLLRAFAPAAEISDPPQSAGIG